MAKRKARQPAAPAKAPQQEAPSTSEPQFKNKERVLIVSSRGITFRFRHLMLDMMQLLPHAKKDSKLDTKSDRGLINEVAELKGCTSGMFFETRKHQDLYIWLAKTPMGPTAKFHVTNVHTMAELKLSGNHLKHSRPVLSFDKAFDEMPHLQVLKEMFVQTFAAPRRHPKVKPFFDHVMSFSVADNRIWIRNYQVLPDPEKKKTNADDVTLVEIFAGSFGGPVIYDNPTFVSPNAIRAALKRKKAGKYGARVGAVQKRQKYESEHPLPVDELESAFDE
ncbi:hypothetical protein QBZ16_003918 [Prototheca wickerhamii]|uniref:Brix domain-containing protein n=1 Tax=Prototheca wickerhamii TaxID=3111 RepID=A0AAD9IJZ6_PROWI|nr:hypothetical protein QBZ16_003918 [Prototheca wickerhamii]